MTAMANEGEEPLSLYEQAISDAVRELRFLEEASKLPREREIPKIRWAHIEMEDILGYGGFSQVNHVFVKSPLLEGRHFALKCLDEKLLKSKNKLKVIEAALDLAVEADILSRLDHENIIKLHGVPTMGLVDAAFSEKSMRDYFLLLDVLDETLLDRLHVWRKQVFLKSLVRRPLSKKKMVHRIQTAAIGVAAGMEYLHRKNVVLRDLKPENVGFDEKGVVKLFDFGFAREAHSVRSDEIAGSHWCVKIYLAPEMALGLGSDIKADVYSFGVVLWEVASLQKPTEQFKMKKGLCKGRLNYSFRPSVASIPSPALQTLISECWAFRSTDRPDFKKILKVLKVIPMEVSDRPISPMLASNVHASSERTGSDRALEKVSNKGLGIDHDERSENSTRSDSKLIGVTYTAGPLVNGLKLQTNPADTGDNAPQLEESPQPGEANKTFKESLSSTNTAPTDPHVSSELPMSVQPSTEIESSET